MSDSGFSGLPPGPRTGDQSFPQSLIELKAKIIELRGELKVQRVRETLEGEILRHNPDGTTRIRTDKGEITVELRGRDLPPEGAKVQVEIPPGNPPRQVVVRPAPETAAPPPATPAPAPSVPVREPVADAPLTRRAPVIDARTAEELARQIAALPKDQSAPVPLRPQDVIRLLPLTPLQVRDILLPPLPAPVPAQATPLPQNPQIALPTHLFDELPNLLTLPRAAALLVLHDLPTHLPLFTHTTHEPFAGYKAAPEAAPSFSVAANLIRQILTMNQPGAASGFQPPQPAPVLISPAAAVGFAAPEELPSSAALLPPASGGIKGGGAVLQLIAGESKEPAFLLTSAWSAPVTAFIAPGPFDVRIQTITPPQIKLLPVNETGVKESAKPALLNIPSLPSLQAGPAGSLTGEVAGLTPQSLPVLSFFVPGFTVPQHFVMQFAAANLPQGAQVQVMPLPGAAALQGAALPPFVPFEFFSSFGWPAMEELTQLLQQAAPQAAQVLSNITANAAAPTRVPVAALFFVAAIRSGDVSGWLGDKTVDTLRRLGKSDLLSRLSRDVAGLQRTAAEPAGEWRANALPMMWDGQMHKMMLYYRHDDKNEKEGEESRRGTRFIFDLNLNRLGAVQLDGLHRQNRLDLIVRTRSALSPVMQQTMRRTYIEALGQSGISGELSFQNKPGQFVRVEMPKKAVAL